jgi:hypothetical protein
VSSFNDANSFWNYAMGNDDNMQQFISGGVNVYSQWNIILDTSGANIAKWRQFAPIMIDTVGKKVTFTPQFHQMRHYSYIKPGAFRVAVSGTHPNINALGFRNLDGENILIATNKSSSNNEVAINFNGQKIKPVLPANSFNTFRFPGTPIPPVNPFAKVEAESFSRQSGILRRPCSEGGSCVTLVGNNDWTVYHNVDFGVGCAIFEARVSGGAGGSIEVHLDSSNGTPKGTCTVPATAAWSTVSCPVTGVSGKHTLYLKFKGTGTGNLFSLNWFDFTGTSTVMPGMQAAAVAANYPRLLLSSGSAKPLSGVAGRTGTFAIYDLTGKRVCSVQSNGKAKGRISNSVLRTGVYIVK